MPAANVFLTSSGTRCSSRWRIVSVSSSSSSRSARLRGPVGRRRRALGLRACSSSLAIPLGYPRSASRSTWYPAANGGAGAQRGPSRRHGCRAAAAATSGGTPAERLGHDARRRVAALSRRREHVAPPPLRIRSLRAYWTTFLVIGSYLWLRLRARLHSDAWIEHALRAIHLRNARRIERTICELQGLFIKVGQLISIMTNFLPEEFRRELEGLQDAVPPRPYDDIEARIVEELGKPPRRAVRAVRAPADRVGVDRPGPPRAPARRHARSRSRCSTPTSRRSCGAISTRCAASSASSSGSCRTRASTSCIARSARS